MKYLHLFESLNLNDYKNQLNIIVSIFKTIRKEFMKAIKNCNLDYKFDTGEYHYEYFSEENEEPFEWSVQEEKNPKFTLGEMQGTNDNKPFNIYNDSILWTDFYLSRKIPKKERYDYIRKIYSYLKENFKSKYFKIEMLEDVSEDYVKIQFELTDYINDINNNVIDLNS